jgi:hypothetical protein
MRRILLQQIENIWRVYELRNDYYFIIYSNQFFDPNDLYTINLERFVSISPYFKIITEQELNEFLIGKI